MDRANWTEALVRALHPEFLPAWEAAEAKGRAEGIEAAAKVADARYAEEAWAGHYRIAGKTIASAIRALSQGSGIEVDTPAPPSGEVGEMVERLREMASDPTPDGIIGRQRDGLHVLLFSARGELRKAATLLESLSRNEGAGR